MSWYCLHIHTHIYIYRAAAHPGKPAALSLNTVTPLTGTTTGQQGLSPTAQTRMRTAGFISLAEARRWSIATWLCIQLCNYGACSVTLSLWAFKFQSFIDSSLRRRGDHQPTWSGACPGGFVWLCWHVSDLIGRCNRCNSWPWAIFLTCSVARLRSKFLALRWLFASLRPTRQGWAAAILALIGVGCFKIAFNPGCVLICFEIVGS